jgi:hypothetical protein
MTPRAEQNPVSNGEHVRFLASSQSDLGQSAPFGYTSPAATRNVLALSASPLPFRQCTGDD